MSTVRTEGRVGGGGGLKDKINEVETNRKNKKNIDLCRGINEYTKGYQPGT
jgi:hypothetical protein